MVSIHEFRIYYMEMMAIEFECKIETTIAMEKGCTIWECFIHKSLVGGIKVLFVALFVYDYKRNISNFTVSNLIVRII